MKRNTALLLGAVASLVLAFFVWSYGGSYRTVQVANAQGAPITDAPAAKAALCAGSPSYLALSLPKKTQSDYEFGEPVTARKPDDIRVALRSYLNRDPAAASAITAAFTGSQDPLDARTALFADNKQAWCAAVDQAMTFAYKANVSVATAPKGVSSLYMVASNGKSVSLQQDVTVAPHPVAVFTLGKQTIELRLDQSFAPVQAKPFAYANFLLSPCRKYADQRC